MVVDPATGLRLYRFTRAQYDQMVGRLEEPRVELLRGTIVEMSPRGSQHDEVMARLVELLMAALARRARVRVQSAFVAADESEPEPDIAVVPARSYMDGHPSEAFLLVEVADSSLTVDRDFKAKLYAESAVPEYWIVNIPDRQIEVHTDIVRGAYTRVVPYRPGQSVHPAAFADVVIPVERVFG